MRRGNGTGSVSKLSRNLRKPWRVMIPNGRSETGRYKSTVLGYYRTRQEAEMALNTWLDAPTDKPDITLEEVYQDWSKKHYPKISKQTVDCYTAAWRRFEPLAKVKMRSIRSGQLQEIIDTEPGSNSTKSKIRAVAVQLWDYALYNDIVSKNYAKNLELKKEDAKEKKIFNAIQRKKIEELAKTDEIAQTIVVLYYTGFRINEFLGLTPFSLVRENGEIIAFRGGLKTVAGKDRIVPIHNKIQPILAHWLEKQGNDYIFCNEKGGRMADSVYRKKFKECLSSLGMEGYTPHSTRHTFFTMMNEAGIPESQIMRIGGHSDPAMTNHYTHAEISTLKAAVNRLK